MALGLACWQSQAVAQAQQAGAATTESATEPRML